MSVVRVVPPFEVFPDVDGDPLDSGSIYIGQSGLNPEVPANQLPTYWDINLTIPATQPIRTLGGFPIRDGTPANFYVDSASYSISVRNKNGSLVYSDLTVVIGGIDFSSGLLCETVSDMKAAAIILVDGKTISSAEAASIADTGVTINTTYNNSTSKRGGGSYELKTLAQQRLDIGDPTWVADGQINHYLFGATTYVAVLSGSVTSYKVGMIGDGVTDDLTIAQIACDYLGKYNLGKFFVENGTYYFSNNFSTGVNQTGLVLQYSNFTLEFESKAAIFKTDPTSQRRAISVQFGTDSNPSQAIDGIIIRNGKLDGMNTTVGAVTNEYSHGISVRRSSGVVIENMDIVRFRGDQIFVGYGADTVRIEDCNIDGQRTSSVSGTRQGIAVLSGQNIWILNNKIKGGLLGVDLECDDNQISFGYDFLRNIWVENNEIEDMGSEGFGLITPLVSSPIDISNIHVNHNNFLNISESVMDFDIDANAGSGRGIECIGNTSDGSSTFKGIVCVGISDAIFAKNIILNNANIGLHISSRCSNIQLDGNEITSIGNDAVRVQENVATTRNPGIQFNGGKYVTTSGGSGIEVSGAWDISINGGEFIGDQSGITVRGSSVAGTATDVVLDVTGGVFECSVNTGYGLISDADLRSVAFTGSHFKNASGATYVTRINSVAPQPTFLNHCKYSIAGSFTADGRAVCDNQAGPDRVIITDGLAHRNTSAELNNIAHYSNTVSKYVGKQIYNSTLGLPVYTNAATAAALWADGVGTTRNTPV